MQMRVQHAKRIKAMVQRGDLLLSAGAELPRAHLWESHARTQLLSSQPTERQAYQLHTEFERLEHCTASQPAVATAETWLQLGRIACVRACVQSQGSS
jgi:hypothetical protein